VCPRCVEVETLDVAQTAFSGVSTFYPGAIRKTIESPRGRENV
jgi:hypothetical protein